MRSYVTTAIDYPNAAPHMGHVLEKVLADVLARWKRLCGEDVRFQIGTDEHGIKIQRTAEGKGMTPQELVDTNVPLFEDLYKKLHISHDVFIRTSDRQQHWPTVQALWNKLKEAGKLEKRAYTGLYCSGCERFMTKRDLENGVCPIHKYAPEEVTEENWFFRIHEDADYLKELLTHDWDGEQYRIIPSFRENEALSLLEQGLEDVSFSRPTSSLSWGIPVPEDSSQTMYVWCDALTNYISGLGFFTDHEEREWWDHATVTHVIGKDIARFHALIWPSMLHAAKVRMPDELLIHGFLTSEGEKMSKSLGNVVQPLEVLERFHMHPDPIRFYLSHEVPVGRDGDFSWQRFEDLYNAKLRNALGNLLNRVLILLKKEDGTLSLSEDSPLLQRLDAASLLWSKYREEMDDQSYTSALQLVMKIVDECNAYIDSSAPWKLETTQKVAVLSEICEALRHVSLMLLPFIPETAQRISAQLQLPYADSMLNKNFVLQSSEADLTEWRVLRNSWKSIGEPSILFQPLS